MNQSTHCFDDKFVIPSLHQQLGLFDAPEDETGVYFNAPVIDLEPYDHFLVFFSGGKDSWACLLHLLDSGVDPSHIETHHHLVDGNEGSTLMDWPFSDSYAQKVAEAYGLSYYRSWLQHGFEGELNKQDSYSHPHKIETPEGLMTLLRDTKRAKPGTRRRFPQQSA